ncbi:MAG: Rho termination factor N-terminal domain-containing protein [Proteobacteria bacterium]|nr:Rho termination factor N-terminal domain-containing protein [Pseudomonadota bacterium]
MAVYPGIPAPPPPRAPYAGWTRADLVALAQDLGIKGRSMMTREELISALLRE